MIRDPVERLIPGGPNGLGRARERARPAFFHVGRLWAISCFLALVPLASAYSAASPLPGTKAGTAILTLENRLIVTFRVRFGQLSPRQRVALAQRRIGMLEDPVLRARIVTAQIADGMLVSVDAEPVFVVVPGDLDPVFHGDLGDATKTAVERLALALSERAERRRPAFVLQAAGRSILATLIFVGALLGLSRTRGWLAGRLRRFARRHMSPLEVAGVDTVKIGFIFARFVVHLAFAAGILFAAYGRPGADLRACPQAG